MKHQRLCSKKKNYHSMSRYQPLVYLIYSGALCTWQNIILTDILYTGWLAWMFHSINTILIPFRSEYNVARQFTIVSNYSFTTFNFSLCVNDTRTKRCKSFLIQEKHKADFFVLFLSVVYSENILSILSFHVSQLAFPFSLIFSLRCTSVCLFV